MATYASDELRWFDAASNALPDYPSSVSSGMVGDAAHRKSNSYHNSLNDNPNKAAGSYTNNYPDDRVPPGTWSKTHCCANDQSMNVADMVRQWSRYEAVFYNGNDPRRKYLAEYIGWNGKGEAERLDYQANKRTVSTKDHKWHAHKVRRRKYWNSRDASIAMLSIEKGESPAQYLASIGQAPAPQPPVELPDGEEYPMKMYHAVDEEGNDIVVDNVVYYALVGSDLTVRVHPAMQDTANAVAGHQTGNSRGLTKEVWNDLMDWLAHPTHRFAKNPDGTLSNDMVNNQYDNFGA